MARYQSAARFYDTLSLERWLYVDGRAAAIAALRLGPGDRALDLGAGTGLSLPGLAAAVGDGGYVHGVERSEAMLAQARRRVASLRVGTSIDLTCASMADRPVDGTSIDLTCASMADRPVDGTYDAALFAYSLSVAESWQAAWRWAIERVRPGGRIAVLDTDWPRGVARALAPGAAGLFVLGAVHPGRRVWELPQQSLLDVSSRSWRAGHVRLAVGTVPQVTDDLTGREGSRPDAGFREHEVRGVDDA